MANAIIGFVFCFKGHKGFSELRPECTVFTIYMMHLLIFTSVYGN